MAVQTTYSSNISAGVIGAQATELPATIISRNVETAAGLAFGVAAAQGTADKGVIAFTTGGKFVGITLRDESAFGDGLFPQNSEARIITKGDVWVTASVAVAAGDAVYLVAATGLFTNVSTSNVAIPNARFDTTAAAGALAVVRLG